MRFPTLSTVAAVMVMLALASGASAADKWGLKKGNPDLKSATSLAFGPDGILLVGDAKAASVFAIGTGDTKGDPAAVNINIEGVNAKAAAALGNGTKSAKITDLAVNPLSGNIYLAVSRSDGGPAIVRIDSSGSITEFSLKGVGFLKATLVDAPEDAVVGKGRRRRNQRMESITDLAYNEGKVIVSGRAAGTAPSTVRELAFPFNETDQGTSIEIFHGAHGRLEDSAVARVFVPFNINGEPSLLAGFTCTPLVKFPIESLKPGKKVRGTTVAELGNRNRPLDMIVYKKDGRQFLLMANSSRGVMKISTEDLERQTGITERVGGTAGQSYETIENLKGVVQLDKLTDKRGVIISQTTGSSQDLATIDLP